MLLLPWMGPTTLMLSVVPAAAAGWMSHLRGALRVAVVLLVINGSLLTFGLEQPELLTSLPFAVGHALVLVLAVAAGRMAEAYADLERAHTTIEEELIRRKELEAQLVQSESARVTATAEAQLHRANRLAQVGTMAAGVGHEINNPLTFVLINLRHVLDELLPSLVTASQQEQQAVLARVGEALADASEGGERIRHVVGELKQMAASTDSDEQLVDVEHALRASARMASHNFGPSVRFEQEHHSSGKAVMEPSRVGQVLINLLSNAAHAVQGRERQQVTLHSELGEDGLRIEVRDTGGGIRQELLDRVFDPFFTTKAVGQGTGLGLAVCRSIVQEMGGTLTLESVVDEGTVVRLHLPQVRPVQPVSGADKLALPAAPAKRTVLLVDDEEPVVRAVVRLLRGCEVRVALGGEEALQALAEERFEVVLCDLMMPGMDGTELYQQVLATDPDTAARFLFMTGGAYTTEARCFVLAHADRVVEKPLGSELLEWVRAFEPASAPAFAPVCPKVDRCAVFPRFESREELAAFKRQFCQAVDGAHRFCHRFRSAERGVMPSPQLLPDGSMLPWDATGEGPPAAGAVAGA